MFAVEIDSSEGSSEPEIKLLERPYCTVGVNEYCQIRLNAVAVPGEEWRFYRSPGAEFIWVHRQGEQLLSRENVQFEKAVTVSGTKLNIFALDSDLRFPRELSADRAGAAILKQAMRAAPEPYPALVLSGPEPMAVSFGSARALLIGRGKNSDLRIDLPEVSTEQARVIRDAGGYALEDLGSSNGTFLNGERISGRVSLKPGDEIRVGANSNLTIAEELRQLSEKSKKSRGRGDPELRDDYPCIIGHSEAFQPQRISLPAGTEISLGREPSNDVQLSAAHISRQHVVLRRQGDGRISICDLSSNGTYINGQRLEREKEMILPSNNVEVDLAQGIKFSVCDCAEQEAALLRMLERPAPKKPSSARIVVPPTVEASAPVVPETRRPALENETSKPLKRERRPSAEITRSLEILDVDSHTREMPVMSRTGKLLFTTAVVVLAALVIFLAVWLFSGAVFNY